MRIAIWAAVALELGVLTNVALGQQRQQEPLKADPLVGQWEGKWSYTTGKDIHEGTFRLFFDDKSGKLQGRFVALALTDRTTNPANRRLIGKPRIKKVPYRPESIRSIIRTVTDPPNYRFSADGHCWNVAVKENLMAGFRHSGQCSSVGVGAGTTLIDVGAKRVTPNKR